MELSGVIRVNDKVSRDLAFGQEVAHCFVEQNPKINPHAWLSNLSALYSAIKAAHIAVNSNMEPIVML